MRRRTYGLIWIVSHFIAFLPIVSLFMPRGIFRSIFGNTFVFTLWVLLALLMGVVNFFASTKRLHDMDESGQMAFLTFTPMLGTMYSIWILFQPYSDLGGENKYGVNPRFPPRELEE
jgi:uncharacterized membrane protein YhaH (DUF805 family)